VKNLHTSDPEGKDDMLSNNPHSAQCTNNKNTDTQKIITKLESSQSPQVPLPRQNYSPGGVAIFALPVVSLMPPLTQW